MLARGPARPRHPRPRRRLRLLGITTTLTLVGTLLVSLGTVSTPAVAWERKSADCPYNTPATISVEMGAVPAAYGPSLRAAVSAWNAWAGVTGITVQAVNGSAPPGTIPVTVNPVDSSSLDSDYFATMGTSCSSERGLTSGFLTIVRNNLAGASERLRQNVFTHEIGHLLGLAHNTYQYACSTVMENGTSESAQCPDRFGPFPDDIAGVLAVWRPTLTHGFPARSRIASVMYASNVGLLSSSAYASGRLNPLGFASLDSQGYSEWTFVPDSDNWGWVVNSGSGLCLKRRGYTVNMDYCRGDEAKWAVNETLTPGWEGMELRNKVSGTCLAGLSPASLVWAYAARMKRCGTWGADTTSLTIAPWTTTRTKRSIPDAVAPGQPIVGWGSQRCVTVDGGARTVGTGLSLRGCDGSVEQKWELEPRDGGYALIVYRSHEDRTGDDAQFEAHELCAEGSGSAVAVTTCARSTPQTWTIASNGTIRNAATGTCLNVRGGGTSDGSPLMLYGCGTSSNEIWTTPGTLHKGAMSIVSADTSSSPIGTGAAPAGDADQRTRGAIVHDFTSSKTRWGYTDVPGTGGGLLRNADTDTCLRWKAASQQTVLDEACDGTDSSYRWATVVKPNGSFTIQNQYTGECVDLSKGSTAEGNAVLTFTCQGSPNQLWRAVPNPFPAEDPISVTRVPANPAMFGTASQSSTYDSVAGAANAIDGNPDGVYGNGSVTHTLSQAGAWWQVDLGAKIPVDTITLYNRTDCCGERLADFWVMASPTPFPTTGTAAEIAASPGVVATRVPASVGRTFSWVPGGSHRYVRVQLAGTNFLSLAEVSVTRSW